MNVAVHLAAQGAAAAYLGAVGNDAEGLRVREVLEAQGVDCTRLATRQGNTAVTWIEVRDGERVILGDRPGVQCPLCLNPEDMKEIVGCRAIHCSAFTSWNITSCVAQPALVQEIDFLSQKGCFISLDFSDLEQPELARELGKFLSVAFTSLGSGASSTRVEQAIRYFHDCGTPEVIVTLGSGGAVYSGHGQTLERAARPIVPVDTLGAGDAFIAGWLFGRLRGDDAAASLDRATDIAAEVCLHFGAWPLQIENLAHERRSLDARTAHPRG